MRILYSGYRDSRHSQYGGYDWISKYPGADYLDSNNLLGGSIKSGNKWKIINFFILDLVTRIKMNKYDIVHCFYADLTIFFPFRRRRTKIVTTIHLNESLKYRVNIYKTLKTCDAVITLSSQQASFLRSKYNLNTFFIPHGFNKPVWNKGLIPKSKNGKIIDNSKINIICIGKQYRDNELLVNTVNIIANEKINFHIVGNRNVHSALIQNENVFLYDFLSDDEYYSILERCDYNFMPLTFSTANNALLESQSLGVVSILPQIAGIEDYASPQNIFYSNQDELLNIFPKLQKCEKSIDIIDYSKKFEWENIYKQLEQFYSSLLSK